LFSGVQSFVGKVNQALEKFSSGKWTPENKTEMLKMVNNIKNSIEDSHTDYLDRFSNRQEKIYGNKFGDPSDIRNFIFGNTETKVQEQNNDPMGLFK